VHCPEIGHPDDTVLTVRTHVFSLELSRNVGAVLPVAALDATLEDALIATGHVDDNNSASARAVQRLSGL
jgi:hypothetical protein